ncbi:unnamed protein product [Cylicocyclus nassatus]|uniref:Uncharacterized protein n=1 Tax=Cylicocyclus nassatus TaxID=53992 RepID=A0AA36GPK5_CYLNA|nr:unnamed protein product [Cylicocyclus nassatus]
MDYRSELLSSTIETMLIFLLSALIAIVPLVECKKSSDPKDRRKEGGGSAKLQVPPNKEVNGTKPVVKNTEAKEKQEDTFLDHKPKVEEAKRAKDIKNAKAGNAGDYKTWNKLMKEDDDFEKPLLDVEEGESKPEKKEDKEKESKEKKDEKDADTPLLRSKEQMK